nr:bidirectional sugar transporter SWEET14-like [Ziziphus jujuba var. spinosa]
MVYIAPIPTFHKVYKKKPTEGFQSLPFVVELFSSMLSIYDAILKGRPAFIAISSIGSVIETFYLAFSLFFVPKKSRMQIVLLISLIALGYGLVVILTLFLAKGQKRTQIVGWILLVFNLIVFAAPLCEMMWLYIAYRSSKEISQEPMVNPGLNQVVLRPNDNVGNIINIVEDDNL